MGSAPAVSPSDAETGAQTRRDAEHLEIIPAHIRYQDALGLVPLHAQPVEAVPLNKAWKKTFAVCARTSPDSGREKPVCQLVPFCWKPSATTRSARQMCSELNKSPLMTLKIAVLTPMPSASVMTTVRAKSGLLAKAAHGVAAVLPEEFECDAYAVIAYRLFDLLDAAEVGERGATGFRRRHAGGDFFFRDGFGVVRSFVELAFDLSLAEEIA